MKRTLSAHGGAAIYLIAILVNLGIQLLGSIVLAVVMLLSGNGGVPGFVNYILMAVLQLGFLLLDDKVVTFQMCLACDSL